jgi:exosortase B
MLAFGLLLYAVGRSQGIALFEVGSHLPVLAGTVLLLLGWRALARLWFPLFFLVFLVPLPGFVIDSATAPLKNFVSHIVESMLYELGYPIARAGVILMIGQYQMLVTDACSGLNSLYSLAALSFLYLYLTGPGTLVRNAVLIASIAPIALVANIARVLLLTLITFYFGEEAGQSFLHGFAGMTLFVTALLLLLGLDVLLQRRPVWRGRRAPK